MKPGSCYELELVCYPLPGQHLPNHRRIQMDEKTLTAVSTSLALMQIR